MLPLRAVIRRYSSSTSSARVLIKDLSRYAEDKPAHVYGWIKSVRKHKDVTFLDINDGSSLYNIQVVLPAEDFTPTQYVYGSAIGIEGKINRKKGTKKLDVVGEKILFYTPCEPSKYAFASEWNYPNEYSRRFPHLRPRQRNVTSMLRVRSKVEMLIHKYFQNLNYTHIHTPAITSSDCEGAGELFTVTTQDELKNGGVGVFFGTAANLTVSGQLHLEACSMGMGNVYTLSPVFRAEKSRPKTHISEFHMLEVEMAFTKHLNDVKELVEENIKFVLSETLNSCEAELSFFFNRPTDGGEMHLDVIRKFISQPFLNMEYKDVIDLINSNQKFIKTGSIKWGDDLNDEHEAFLTAYHNGPVFVQNFPSSIKPFYTLSNDDDTSASFDLLFPNCGEIAGGTLREHRHDILHAKLQKLNLIKKYKWYLELREFGGVPHGGYGLGFDRLIKFILGMNNIKDVVPFPRAKKFCLM